LVLVPNEGYIQGVRHGIWGLGIGELGNWGIGELGKKVTVNR
jgi:hypothetical protein